MEAMMSRSQECQAQKPVIQVNSFYDLYPEYTESEFQSYKKYVGLPNDDAYDELIKRCCEKERV